MKKILFLFLAALPLFSFAQEKDIYDTAADRMCQYINEHADAKINSQKDAETMFSQGFLKTCMPLVEQLMAKEGISTFDRQAGMVIGKKVGLKLAVMCPKYLEIMSPVIKDQLQHKEEPEAGSVKGTVIQVLQDGYTYLKIKLADGTQKRLVWLMSFDDAENVNNNPQKLLNKQVVLQWKPGQLYYFKSNSFAAEKIITGFSIN